VPVIFTPLRLDRLQRALFSVMSEATGLPVAWDYQEVPMEARGQSFVGLTMTVAPAPVNRMHRRGPTIEPISTVMLTVGPVVVGTRVGIVLNDFNYFEDVVAGDTDETVRDRLAAQIEDPSNIEPVAATPVGVDALSLTADFVGAIASLSVYGTVSAGAPVFDTQHVQLVEGTQVGLVTVEAYSKLREPRLGASAIIQQCHAALQSEDLVERLRADGVGIWNYTPPADLSAIAGAHWETRQAFDVNVAARARWARPVDIIETVSGTANGVPFSAVSP